MNIVISCFKIDCMARFKALFLVLFLFLVVFVPQAKSEDNFSMLDLGPENTPDIEGYVEYIPEDAVLFQKQNGEKSIFDELKKDVKIESYSVKNVQGVDFEEIKNRRSIKKHIGSEYEIVDIYADYSHKAGNFTYGTSYTADIDIAEFEYNTKFYAKYDYKMLGFTAAYGKDSYTTSGIQRDFLYFTPEIKLGKGFVLKDTFRASVLGINTKNAISLKYTPKTKKFDDRMDFELSFGQLFYKNGSSKNVVKFSTTLRL